MSQKNKEMKFARFLANRYLIIAVSILFFLIITIVDNLFLNSLDSFFMLFKKKSEINIIKNLINLRIKDYLIVYIISYLLGCIILIKKIINIRASYGRIEEGQKGTSKFVTLKEVKEQYKSIKELEDKEEFESGGYDGKGGIVVCRNKDRIFIDDSPVNNLIIGITRSGKGELWLFPTIDVYSRAKEKSSMILNDPKGELVSASKDILEKRGYRVEVLNLLDPMKSMSYNPLQLIIDAYEKGNEGEAQSLCKTLTYTLYFKPGTKDPFWQNSAMSLVNALILSVISESFTNCNALKKEIKDREEFISMLKDTDKLYIKNKERIQKCYTELEEWKSKMTLFTVANMLSELGSKEDDFGDNELDKYFQNLPSNSVAKMQYASSNFAKGTARGGIFSTAMSELQIFTFDDIAKMTSKNSINLEDVGFKNGKDDRPIALFMVTPDYDKSNHVIASIFVRQLYYILAKKSSLNPSGKCDREVIFLLDEFGNMPPIEGMDTIITVCLGRNIRFNMVIQAYSQLEELYGKGYKTIVGNCGNQLYILTNEKETAEKYSELIGSKTIVTYSRSGEIFDTTKHQTESVDSRRLLDSNELMNLKEGEMVVVRVIKRTDLKGNKIIAYPIFCSGEMEMKYRYQYLSKFFDNSKSLLDVDVKTIHADVNLDKLLINFNKDIKEEDIESEDIEKEEEINNLNDKYYLMSEIFTMDEIEEISTIVSMYTSDKNLLINMNTKFEIFEKFVEGKKDDYRLNELLEQGKKSIVEDSEIE